MLEVFTLRLDRFKFLAYTADKPGTPAKGDTEEQSVVSLLEREGVISRTRVRHEDDEDPVVLNLTAGAAAQAGFTPAHEKLDGLTLQQAVAFAKAGRKITRAGHETQWYLMNLPAFLPHLAKIHLNPDGTEQGTAVRWPHKAPQNHPETAEHVEAKDWKVL